MSSFNKVVLLGNLTRDPELRFIPSGAAVTTLGLAVNNPRVENETMFIDVTVWNKPAENCAKYLTKGSSVLIEGRLTYRTWEDKQSGQKRGKHEVVAETVQFIRTGRGGGGNSDGEGYSNEYAQESPAAAPASRSKGTMPPVDIPDDDIPF